MLKGSNTQRGYLAGQPPHRKVTYSEAIGMASRNVSVERVVEILAEIELFDDDRPDSLEQWLLARIGTLPEQIVDEVNMWWAVMRGRRGRARTLAASTIKSKVGLVLPALREWSQAGHSSLREITRAQVEAHIGALQDAPSLRRHHVHALRHLFRTLRQQRMIFRDPTVGMTGAGLAHDRPLTPLDQHDLAALAAAAVDPVDKLLVVLAAVQGLRSVQIARLRLEHVDLERGLLRVGTHTRPLGALTLRTAGIVR